MYRVGFPFWKLAAHLGIPLSLRMQVMHDDEADVYIATSTDLAGLVHNCAEMLIERALHRPLKRAATLVWDGKVERTINFVMT